MPCALIGALAMAAHGYTRATRDLDLATFTDPFTVLREVATELSEAGLRAELRYPDADDPLGGLLRVSPPSAMPIEVVNFLNPLRRSRGTLEREALASASEQPDLGLRVVDFPHLVALKLKAGGPGDVRDVLELLRIKHPPDVKAVCVRHRLGSELERVLAEL
ncbi:MAG TPA: hypothetical protein VFA20_18070 [Myxococcaceae bacterium]|nr:hypothetical protein [Myxococcaceae bacterium]